ncbi:hypothetical protein GCM10023183_14210 [Nibribacter koreensis]|uniref:Uncharacterized protein n=1 Tax=Nibribacter koreensis TaxID=1084519 RepID=A0ABP8FFE2_9BACT
MLTDTSSVPMMPFKEGDPVKLALVEPSYTLVLAETPSNVMALAVMLAVEDAVEFERI